MYIGTNYFLKLYTVTLLFKLYTMYYVNSINLIHAILLAVHTLYISFMEIIL